LNVHALFGLSALMSLLASAIGAKVFLWRHLQGTNRNASLLALVAPHIGPAFSLDEIKAAVRQASTPERHGKILLRMNSVSLAGCRRCLATAPAVNAHSNKV
jgi:hypothetical protein